MGDPRIVAISQARMTSTRLPGKVLLPAAGKPLLAHHLERLARTPGLDAVVLATTANAADDPLAACAEQLGVAVFRGDEQDVLGRFAGAAAMAGADLVVRVTADCPLIDPALVGRLIAAFGDGGSDAAPDYLSIDSTLYPRGLDAEIFPRALLEEADSRAVDPAEREHVTPYIYNRPDRFRVAPALAPETPVEPPGQRWCVDEPADYDLVRRLIEALVPVNPEFGWQDCCRILRDHPDWVDINRSVRQKTLHWQSRKARTGTDPVAGRRAAVQVPDKEKKIMDRKEFLLALDEMLELDPGTLTGDETLETLDNWDSLAVISFIALVDEKTGVVVEGEKLAKAKTVADLMVLAGVPVAA